MNITIIPTSSGEIERSQSLSLYLSYVYMYVHVGTDVGTMPRISNHRWKDGPVAESCYAAQVPVLKCSASTHLKSQIQLSPHL